MNKVDVVVLESQCDVTEEISLSTLNLYGHLQDRKVTSKMALKHTYSEESF